LGWRWIAPIGAYSSREESPDKYTEVADVKTMNGARMLALDAKTQHIFTIGTEGYFLSQSQE
jgi:hypothetical protein